MTRFVGVVLVQDLAGFVIDARSPHMAVDN